jgi:hemerythrin superfamily protein
VLAYGYVIKKGENMNAIDTLKLDHRVVDALFEKAMSMQPSKRGPVYKKISNELAAHAHIEEKIFYPRLLKDGNKELKKIVLEGIEEHSQIHMFHDQLDTMKPAEEKFEPKFKVLKEDIRHHVKEEENEMFDLVESQFSSEALERLGEEMEAERMRFQKAKGIPKRTAADNALGQGMLTRFVDAVTGLFTDTQGKKSMRAARGGNGRAASSSKKGSPGKKASGNAAPRSGSKAKSSASTSSGGRSSAKASRSNNPAKTAKTGSRKTATYPRNSPGGNGGSTTRKSATSSARSKTASGSRRSATK